MTQVAAKPLRYYYNPKKKRWVRNRSKEAVKLNRAQKRAMFKAPSGPWSRTMQRTFGRDGEGIRRNIEAKARRDYARQAAEDERYGTA